MNPDTFADHVSACRPSKLNVKYNHMLLKLAYTIYTTHLACNDVNLVMQRYPAL